MLPATQSISNIPHTRVNKLERTVSWYQYAPFHNKKIPLRNTSIGGMLSVLAAAVAVFDLTKVTKNSEGGFSSTVGILGRGLLWIVGIIPWTYLSQAPKNLRQVNLFNNFAKKLSKDVGENISKGNCFANVLSKSYINKLRTQTNSLLETTFNLIKEFLTDNNEIQSETLSALQEEINNSFGKSSAEVLKNYFGLLFRNEDLYYGFDKLSRSEPGLANYIKHNLFVGKKVNNIRDCINEVLIPLGLKLTPIQYDSANDSFELCVVPLEGLSADTSKPDSNIILAGALIHISPSDLGFILTRLVKDLTEVSKLEIIKQYRNGTATQEQIATLNKKVLSSIYKNLKLLDRGGFIEAVEAEHDPKLLNHYELTHTRLPLSALFNAYGWRELSKLYSQLSPELDKTTIGDNLNRGLDSGLSPEFVSAVPRGYQSPGTTGYGTGSPMDKKTAREFKNPIELRESLLQAPRMKKVMDKLPHIDLRLLPSDTNDVKKLKYCLAKIATYTTAMEEHKSAADRSDFVRFAMNQFKTDLPYFKDDDCTKINIRASANSNSKYRLPAELLKIDYFFKIAGTDFQDPHALEDISDLLNMIDEEQRRIILKEYNEKCRANRDNNPVTPLPEHRIESYYSDLVKRD
ncbi:MAG: hypothetical protein A3I68_01535 [Candidatus Melainabacteria bacterium RIFCSPLOWO2_02_FULL_35_15]|nr:MAG: hypothetical protein A3F80_04845 [Candidatus Melainabacteria bacterium RIFCSPLOWO2_12_FULL_35_11]OGI12993.1 MAG: hypothetical protein A3I68_01535 [Candidatus Melainabacteria bacterium RIFCSPLOWO2_02_FULL_35_15]